MRSTERTHGTGSPQLLRGTARKRWQEKERRSSNDSGDRETPPSGLRATSLVVIAGILLAAFVVVMLGRPEDVTAQVIQQAPSISAAVEQGKVTVSIDEVKTRKIVYWDHTRADGTTIPLMAYLRPSGVVNLAVRLCEPCDGDSFRVEGEQLVGDDCDTRWDLETLKGISGDHQNYPPSLLRTSAANGKLTADEARVARWTPRP